MDYGYPASAQNRNGRIYSRQRCVDIEDAAELRLCHRANPELRLDWRTHARRGFYNEKFARRDRHDRMTE